MTEALGLKLGDTVRIVGYGHLIYQSKKEWEYMRKIDPSCGDKPRDIICEDADFWVWDMAANVVGQVGIISNINSSGNQFSLEGIKGKAAWYDRKQLEKVTGTSRQLAVGYIPYEIGDKIILKGLYGTFTIADIRMLQYIRNPKVEFEILLESCAETFLFAIENKWISANIIERRVQQ